MEIYRENWISPAVKSVCVVPLANRIILPYPAVGSHRCTLMRLFRSMSTLCIYSIMLYVIIDVSGGLGEDCELRVTSLVKH